MRKSAWSFAPGVLAGAAARHVKVLLIGELVLQAAAVARRGAAKVQRRARGAAVDRRRAARRLAGVVRVRRRARGRCAHATVTARPGCTVGRVGLWPVVCQVSGVDCVPGTSVRCRGTVLRGAAPGALGSSVLSRSSTRAARCTKLAKKGRRCCAFTASDRPMAVRPS